MSYTKGPYKIVGPAVGAWDKSGDYAVTVPGQNGHDPYIIAEFFMTVDHGVEMPAFENANLFTASHDMLEALGRALHYIETPGDFSEDDHDALVADITKAIAKAIGG